MTTSQHESEAPAPPSWRRRLVYWGLTLAWVVNASLLIVAFVWTYCDGRSLHTMDVLQSIFGVHPHHFDSMVRDRTQLSTAVKTGFAGASIILCTLLIMLGSLFLGGRRFRTMRIWLLFMALVSGWLGFIVGWPEVYWRGQLRRVTPVLAAVESLARKLDANWPQEDGFVAGVGPFLAYPKNDPTTLLPLQFIAFPNTSLRFSAVERTKDGALRFELSGEETGAWLEWRGDDQVPAPFVGGLETSYNVTRQQRLAPRWFLVRYRASAGGVR